MAFTASSLGKLAGSDGFTLWSYTTADTAATVDTAGYFNDAADFMRINDLILAVTGVGGTVSHVIYPVLTNTGGVVDVSNGLVVTATDTD